MMPLYGAMTYFGRPSDLKRQALLFDKIGFVFGDPKSWTDGLLPEEKAEVEFLLSNGIIGDITSSNVEIKSEWVKRAFGDLLDRPAGQELQEVDNDRFWDLLLRGYCANVGDGSHLVPICRLPLPAELPAMPDKGKHTVLEVALKLLPAPSEDSAWDDILHFRKENRDRLWGFRRFLRTLATKHLPEPQIRDELEYLLNDYTEAMGKYHFKATQSFIDVVLVASLELIEDLVKIRWSKIAKGALSVKKREAEMLEAEMKAPGRECAYLFEARGRFGENGWADRSR